MANRLSRHRNLTPVVEISASQPASIGASARTSEGPVIERSSDPSIPPRTVVDGVETVEGAKLQLRFDQNRCIHARFCVLGAPEVFLGNVSGPWIKPDAVDVEDLVAIAHRCPSGAITYTRKDGRSDERAPSVNTIVVRENGPYAFHGELRIQNDGPRFRATLCRCGASQKKPFCDGSHTEAAFEATGEPPTSNITALDARAGVVDVRPHVDGPLVVEGNLELLSGTGRTFAKLTRVKLCRCGQSNTKPYCDGSHRAAGFSTASPSEL
ncbi:MAG: iron-binding protein [Myxococcales bacterium]|nr:iron-binding protein [Myxococcales bacterium]